jgi:hypothetical protein
MTDEKELEGTKDAQGGGQQPEPDAQPRTFTQAELDTIISDRLARERAKFADYGNVKSELERLKGAEEERANAEKTELEKAQDRYGKLEQRYGELESMYQRTQLRQAFYEIAEAEGLRFHDNQAKSDAFDLLDLSDALGDGGKVDQDIVKAKLLDLNKHRPYFFGQRPAAVSDDATQRSQSQPAEITDEDVQEFAARMGVHPQFVDKDLLRGS